LFAGTLLTGLALSGLAAYAMTALYDQPPRMRRLVVVLGVVVAVLLPVYLLLTTSEITGRLIAAGGGVLDGQAVAGVEVVARAGRGQAAVLRTETDETGRFWFRRLRPTTYAVELAEGGEAASTVQACSSLTGGAPVALEYAGPGPSRGRVGESAAQGR